MPEFEETVAQSLEEAEKLIEQEAEAPKDRPRWEMWAAISASLLAVLSVTAALYATFAFDSEQDAATEETIASVERATLRSSYHALETKRDILAALGKPLPAGDAALMADLLRQSESLKEEIRASKEKSKQEEDAHDLLAVAVSLFQLGILLGSTAVLTKRRALWLFGLVFAVAGIGFMAAGLALY